MKLLYAIFLLGHAVLVSSTNVNTTTSTTQTATTKVEKRCKQLSEDMWLLQGCVVENVSAITLTGLGKTSPAKNFKECKVFECKEANGSFTINAKSMDVCDSGLVDTGFTKEG